MQSLIYDLAIYLKLQDALIHLVDEHDWLNLFGESLSKDFCCLQAITLDVIDNEKCTIWKTQRRFDFREKVTVAWSVNYVDKVGTSCRYHFIFMAIEEYEGDTRRLNCKAIFTFVLTSINKVGLDVTWFFVKTSLCDKRVSDGRFAMMYVSNDSDISDGVRLVHNLAYQFNDIVIHRKVDLNAPNAMIIHPSI